MFVGFVLFCLLYVISRVVAFPICPIKHFFGVSCPGCGLTRGFLAVLKFDFRAATEYHLLSVPLFIGVLFYAGGAISDILFERNDIERMEEFCKRKYILAMMIILFLISVSLNYVL